MKFRVKVKNESGAVEARVIDAASRFAVYELVEKEGGSVVALAEGGGVALPAWANITIGSGVKMEERITFTKNLAAMLGAGLTLARALAVIERQSKNKTLKKIVIALEDAVKSGSAFHEALAQYPNVFSKLFISMTKAGEESGAVSSSLVIVAKQMESSAMLTKKVKGAMIYPSIIVAAIFVIAILMLMFVVPTLSSTFESFHTKLPLATRIIVSMSDGLRKNPFLSGTIILVIVGAGTAFFRSKFGKMATLRASLYMPVIGELVRETFAARTARTLSSLLSSGVEMLTTIEIAGEVVGENMFGAVVVEAATRVRKGEPLSAAFSDHPKLFPFFMADMIAVGEETGKVADMLGQVAQYYETDVEDRTKDLSTIIEPLLMLFIGAFVGVFALAMIAPIYSLSSVIS